ncbi:MAG: hypothetical protein ABS35_02370 [Kaistia sp. SCN 65-12]|nr:MAG: hypothetical protein ABS35_02370 [Kaistia sp. SCN 65-12]
MIQPPAPKITIDTNCVVGLFDSKAKTATSVDELRELMRYALSGVIQISITTRVEVDFERDKDDERRNEMVHHMNMLPVIGTVARWDQSKFDGADVLVGPEHEALLEEVKRIVFPGLQPESGKFLNKLSDIDHLVGHKLAGRDVFVTDDNGILRRYAELRDGPGILVMSPAECLRHVDGHYARHQKKTLKPTRDDETYWDKRLKGAATFDYSNNNQRFAIGEGLFLFETRWSKASDTSIHAYRDGASIDAIALVKEAHEFRNITDATGYDFSSRVRSPRLGQIVIWRNVNGLYAATKIVAISDDTRGAAHDELTFEFVILPDGSSDFSAI